MPTVQEALQELLEMSSSVRHAVIIRGDDEVLASTLAGSPSESDMVRTAREILEAARDAASEMDRAAVNQLYVEAKSGCVFIIAGEKDTWLAATTGTDPTVGLVLYDANTALKTALEAEAGAEGSK